MTPAMALSKVVFPAPLGPTSTTSAPFETSSETRSSTAVAPYPAVRFETASRASLIPISGRLLVAAEVGVDDALVCGDRGRRAVGDQLAVVQHQRAVDGAHQPAHGVLDPEHGDAQLTAQSAHQRGELGVA